MCEKGKCDLAEPREKYQGGGAALIPWLSLLMIYSQRRQDREEVLGGGKEPLKNISGEE